MFNDETGRSLIVAFDHGTEGAIRGGEDLPGMLDRISGSRADGVLLTTGITPQYVRHAKQQSNPVPVCAGLDVPIFSTRIGSDVALVATRQLWSPTDAREAGAIMCKMLLPLGLTDVREWAEALERLGRTAIEARRHGIPFMLEPAFWGPEKVESDRAILDAARLCVELGADILKVPAPQDVNALRQLIAWSPVPVLVLGGAPRDGGEFLNAVVDWVNAGAAGVVVGRNVWNRPDPVAAIDALAFAVHATDLDLARERMARAGTPLSAATRATHDEGAQQ